MSVIASPIASLMEALEPPPVLHKLNLGQIALTTPGGIKVYRQVTVIITLRDGVDASTIPLIIATAKANGALQQFEAVIGEHYKERLFTCSPPSALKGEDQITQVTKEEFSYLDNHKENTSVSTKQAWNVFEQTIVTSVPSVEGPPAGTGQPARSPPLLALPPVPPLPTGGPHCPPLDPSRLHSASPAERLSAGGNPVFWPDPTPPLVVSSSPTSGGDGTRFYSPRGEVDEKSASPPSDLRDGRDPSKPSDPWPLLPVRPRQSTVQNQPQQIPPSVFSAPGSLPTSCRITDEVIGAEVRHSSLPDQHRALVPVRPWPTPGLPTTDLQVDHPPQPSTLSMIAGMPAQSEPTTLLHSSTPDELPTDSRAPILSSSQSPLHPIQRISAQPPPPQSPALGAILAAQPHRVRSTGRSQRVVDTNRVAEQEVATSEEVRVMPEAACLIPTATHPPPPPSTKDALSSRPTRASSHRSQPATSESETKRAKKLRGQRAAILTSHSRVTELPPRQRSSPLAVS